MPTNRRRRSRGIVPDLSEYQRAYLLDHTSGLPDRDDVEAVGWYFFEKHLDGFPQSASSLWLANEPALLAEFIVDRPGTRPREWWRSRAPQPRQRLRGTGTPIGDRLQYGIPEHWQGIDPRDPPQFEAEAGYLRRRGLLLPGEQRRLKPADFEPERVLPELDDVPVLGNAH